MVILVLLKHERFKLVLCGQLCLMDARLQGSVFWVCKNCIYIIEKNHKKRQAGKNKQHQQLKTIKISMYNYEQYTIARFVPNKSIQIIY